MSNHSGQFIAIEGIDGSGKTTQVELLAAYFKEKKMRVETIKFPQYETSFYGRITAAYLRGEFGKLNDISPYSAAILYAANRYEAVPQVTKALSQGGTLISDRYIGSNLAHQGAKIAPKERPEFYEWLYKLEYNALGVPAPDLTLYLNMPVNVAQKLMEQRPSRNYTNHKRDIHEADIPYLEAVREVYLDLARRDPAWVTIQCIAQQALRPVQDIHNDIVAMLRSRKLLP